MIRNVLIPTLAAGLAVLVGGCATGYQYRGGSGDYYYGQPTIEYRDYGYGSYGYGYPGGWSGSLGFGYGYGGFPYGYGYPWYGGYGYPYDHRWRRPVIIVRPDRPAGGHGVHHGDGDDRDRRPDNRPPPWRGVGDLRPPQPPRPSTSSLPPPGRGALPPPPSSRGAVPPPVQRSEPTRSRAPVRVERDRDARRISRP